MTPVGNPERPFGNHVGALDVARASIVQLTTRYPDYFPMYTTGGRWCHRGESWTDWCGGFLAGMMWLLHRHTGDPAWRTRAEHYSRLLEHRKHDRNVHDLGFIFLNTYRRWYEVSADARLMAVVAEAGVTLSLRFQERGQYLASFLGPHSLFVDIMMNVPLLFVAADWLDARNDPSPLLLCPEGSIGIDTRPSPSPPSASGRGAAGAIAAELRRKALAHCRTSQNWLVRPDGSTAHEAIFNTETGEFQRQSTQQGLRPDSCWSRGQAWALYGFATVYRLTRETEFLETACRCADYFIRRLPPEMVPYWDFDVPAGPDRLWDSSAAAIAASGLLDLAELVGDATPADQRGERRNQPKGTAEESATHRGERYRAAALEMLDSLCDDEFLAVDTPGWEGILKHGVYHIHKGLGVDESVMWGDHFFVEALVKAASSVPDR
jgi:unsaturated chondroitin disaccharide hydrolase